MNSKKLSPLLLAALAPVACLLVPWPALADDPIPIALDTPAGRFLRAAGPDATTITLPSGVVVVRTRDEDGQEVGLTVTGPGGRLLDLRHERTDGRRTLTRRGARETAFLHDEAGLLTGVVSEARTFVEHQLFAERVGLRTAFERDGAAEEWTRTAEGRLVAAGERRVRHDAAGRVVEVVGPPGDVGPTWRVRYLRDDRGRLRALEREERDGVTSSIAARVAMRARGAGLSVERVAPGRERTWLRLPGERAPAAYAEGGVWTFLVSDAQGSALLYLDAAGALLAEAEPSPWGEVERAPGDRPVLWRGGRVVDREHLAWLDGRAYSPSLGQHLEPPYGFDPDAEEGGLVGRLDGR